MTTLRLENGQLAMFGYGSLLLLSSMEKTLGKPYRRQRVVCGLKGWQRAWNVVMPNTAFYGKTDDGEFVPKRIVYLNVRPLQGGCVNGVLYVVDAEELEGFDRREWIYDRLSVTSALSGLKIEGGEAYVYVGKAEWLLKPEWTASDAALRQTYLDTVEQGLRELGPEFRVGYEHSTDPVPTELIFSDIRR